MRKGGGRETCSFLPLVPSPQHRYPTTTTTIFSIVPILLPIPPFFHFSASACLSLSRALPQSAHFRFAGGVWSAEMAKNAIYLSSGVSRACLGAPERIAGGARDSQGPFASSPWSGATAAAARRSPFI